MKNQYLRFLYFQKAGVFHIWDTIRLQVKLYLCVKPEETIPLFIETKIYVALMTHNISICMLEACTSPLWFHHKLVNGPDRPTVRPFVICHLLVPLSSSIDEGH